MLSTNCLKGGSSEVVVSLFSRVTVLGQEVVALRCIREVQFGYWAKLSLRQWLRHWHRLRREVVNSLYLEVLRKREDMAWRDMV